MKTRAIRLLIVAGLAGSALGASIPASAHESHGHGHGPHVYARPHLFHEGPRFVVVQRPVVVYRQAYYPPAPVYYAPPAPVYYAQPAPAYYAPAPVYPNWGAVGGAIAGGAIGSTIGQGNGRVAAIAAGSVIGAMAGSRIAAPY